MTDTVFRIRRRTDGLYSTGGYSPNFNKVGKIWKKIGHVNNHLAQAANYLHSEYLDCELVTCELKEIEIDATPIHIHLERRRQTAQEKADAALRAREARVKEARYREYLAMKQEFGDT